MKHFKVFSREDILSLTKIRKFETKIGERISFIKDINNWEEQVKNSDTKFVLIGIPEDIGVKANFGIGGADTNWHPFLSSFLNLQSNAFFSGEEVLLLGNFDFGDIKYLVENTAYNNEELIEAYRHSVVIIDDEVESIIKFISSCNKIPIIVGGGHNNAYPILKGVAKGLNKCDLIPIAQINCINLDAHADYKVTEGRHSGNSFRYAERDGYLQKYFIVGMHESYVQQNVLIDLNENPFIQYATYEDIFIKGKISFKEALKEAAEFMDQNFTGIEIDLDSIINVLSSASTPSGLSVLQARQFINFMGSKTLATYLHISEGVCQLANGRKDEAVGKLISFLVSDFIKSKNELT